VVAAYVTREVAFTTPPLRQWVKKTLPSGVVLTNLVAGGTFACGLGAANSDPDNVGRAYCWGNNFYGQMGNGVSSVYGANYRAPSEVLGIKFKSITPGQTMCGIALDNSTYCWGTASQGSLGNGTVQTMDAKQATPVLVSVPFGLTFAELAQSGDAVCARTTFNEVYCWGPNRYFQLGIGTNDPELSTVPIQIKSTNLLRQMP